MKNRLKKEGTEAVTNCNRLKITTEDGKERLIDAASTETKINQNQYVKSLYSNKKTHLTNLGVFVRI